MASFEAINILDVFTMNGRTYTKINWSNGMNLSTKEICAIGPFSELLVIDNMVDVYNRSKLVKYGDLKLGDTFIYEGRGYVKFNNFCVHIESGIYHTMGEEKLVEKTQNVKEKLCNALRQNN